MPRFAGAVAAAFFFASAAAAHVPQKQSGAAQATGPEQQICRHVVSNERGAKPYELCMTKAVWDAKKAADAKDPNRKVCRYQEASVSRFKSYKVCMTEVDWENQRQVERQAVERIQSSTCVRGAGC